MRLPPFAAGASVVAALVLLSSCGSTLSPSGDSAPTPSRAVREPEATVSTTVAPATTAATTTTTTTSVAPPLEFDGVARVIRTATGVVAPVVAVIDEGWVVRTPCQNEALVTAGEPIDRVHVVIDPGHGGFEPGAVTEDGLSEADLNLRVADLVERKLRWVGIEATLTRYGDHRVPLVSRVEVAESLDAALLVSIHHQGTSADVPRSDTPGTEVYYQKDNAESRRFAGLLREEAVEELGAFDVDDWFAGIDAGAVRRPNAVTGEDFYGMVRLPTMPAVLAEMSFMGNPEEIALLRTRAFINAEAKAIADAVTRWFSTDDPGSGFVEPSFGLRSSGGGGGLGGCRDPDLGPTEDLPAVGVGAAEETG